MADDKCRMAGNDLPFEARSRLSVVRSKFHVRLLMESARIAQILDEMGTILEIQGENPFRCRAYHNAAQVLSSCRPTSPK